MKKTRVLVLGGGFGGIRLIRELRDRNDIAVTLVTEEPTFRYGATVWRAAIGYRKNGSYIPVSDLVDSYPNVTVHYDKALTIDRKSRKVTTEDGTVHHYDFCVIALGVVTSYFGIKGMEEHSFTVKTSKGLDALRQHLHSAIVDSGKLDKNYVIVGAGATGIELAAALRSYIKTIARHHHLKQSHVTLELVEAAPRILPAMKQAGSRATQRRLRKLGVHIMTKTVVKSETDSRLYIGDKSLKTQTVIWTAGVSNNPFFEKNATQFTVNDKKRVIVDEFLRVDEHTYVIGDNAATPYSGLALTAMHNAKYVSKHLVRASMWQKTPRYKPLKPLTIIPVGEGWAVLEWRGLVLHGRAVSWLRALYDFYGYAKIMGARPAFRIWLGRNQQEETCLFCLPEQIT